MDRKLLENILNEFPNIQNDEEFYRDISGIMEPIETGEFVYTDLSYADFLKSKGILKLNKIPRPNQTEIEIKDRAFALSLGKYLVINKDMMEEEVDLDNKIIRLSMEYGNLASSILHSSFEPSLNDLKKVGEDISKRGVLDDKNPDTGNLYSVHVQDNDDGPYSYHWIHPSPSDIFMMTRRGEKDRPVRKLISYPGRAIHLSEMSDPNKRKSSQLTPEEAQRYLYSGVTNLAKVMNYPGQEGTEEPGESEDPEDIQEKKDQKKTSVLPVRLFLPEKLSHKTAGYIRTKRSGDADTGPWNHASDASSMFYAMALAEHLYARHHNIEDPKEAPKLSTEDILSFIQKFTDHPASKALAAAFTSSKARSVINEIKEHMFFKLPDPNIERLSGKGQLIVKHLENLKEKPEFKKYFQSPLSVLSSARVMSPFFQVKTGVQYKLPVRVLEHGNKDESEDKMHQAVVSLARQSVLHPGGRQKPAIEHLMDHIKNLLPIHKINVDRAMESKDLTKIEEAKTKHDRLVMTYLSKFFGTRLGGTSEKEQDDDAIGRDVSIGLSSIKRGNIVDDGDTILIKYQGKVGSRTGITVKDPSLKYLIRQQLQYADKIAEIKGKSPNAEDRVFSGTPNFFDLLKKEEEEKGGLKNLIKELKLEKITGYNFRHYKGTQVGIQQANREAATKIKSIVDKEKLDKLSPEDRILKLKEIAKQLDKLTADLSLEPSSSIPGAINLELSHKPASTTWTSYANPRLIKAAYRQSLLNYLVLLLKEAKAQNDRP